MSRVVYIVVFLIFASLFAPSVAVACGKSCISHKIIKKATKSCCQKKEATDKQSDGCSGKCKNSNCQTVSFCFSAVLQNNVFSKTLFSNFIYRNSIVELQQIGTSAGFYTIWSPPNIT
jgi:hypothetical protein